MHEGAGDERWDECFSVGPFRFKDDCDDSEDSGYDCESDEEEAEGSGCGNAEFSGYESTSPEQYEDD